MPGDNGDQQRKKKLAIMGVSSVLLVAMVAAVAVGNGNSGKDSGTTDISTSQRNVDTLCLSAQYPETCKKSVESAAESGNSTDMKTLIKAAFNATAEEITNQMRNSSLFQELEKDPSTKDAVDVCNEVFGYAVKSINDSIDKVDQFELSNLGEFAYDLKVWLSGAITMQHTCLDGFDNSTTEAGQTMAGALKTALEMSNNALDIVEGFSSVIEDFNLDDALDDVESTDDVKNKSRKLLSTASPSAEAIPTWVGGHQRRLLQVGTNALKADVVVAQDGTGQFKTLTEALNTVPPTNSKPFVIYVKAGVYSEEVTVAANTMNFVVIVGDGATKTRFTGGKSQKDGVTTYHTSSFSVNANNFMAIDVGFENTAGPSAGPAVALRITGDKAVVYRCYMDGHQDTLYPSAYRQFYRDCMVWGTIDFIFGDAVTVFQNCTIMVKRGVDGQEAVVAAGGKSQQAGPSALVFQGCRFLPDPSFADTAAVKNGFKISYLARPWRPYAKTVIIESYIHEIFNLTGYIPFTGSNFENTCTALEFGNVGPASDVSRRVKWPGVNPNLQQSQAAEYYPGRYFQLSNNEGDAWIVSSGVPYASGPMLASFP